MSDKNTTLTLDPHLFANLASESGQFALEVEAIYESNKILIDQLRSDTSGLEGGQGETIGAALDEVQKMSEQAVQIARTIQKHLGKTSDALLEKMKDAGSAELAENIKAKNAKFDKRT